MPFKYAINNQLKTRVHYRLVFEHITIFKKERSLKDTQKLICLTVKYQLQQHQLKFKMFLFSIKLIQDLSFLKFFIALLKTNYIIINYKFNQN